MKASALLAALMSLVFSAPPQANKHPQFEVASMKNSPPAHAGEPININIGSARNGRVTLTNASLNDCIKYAYSIISDSQIAGPDWTKSGDVRFDIIAQAPPDTPQDQLLFMLQTLLAERLKLTLHHEQRTLPFLALVVNKGGPKLSEAKDSAEQPMLGVGHIIHHHISMFILASLLSRFERQLIFDTTDLSGFFDVKLEWTPDALKGRGPEGGGPILLNGAAVDPNGPSLVTALQEQLGLRLDSRKGPIDVLVIDHAEKVPTQN
jgi:uncharacterized protein (TIGR03435 family)